MKIRVKQRVKQNDGPDGALILCEMENIEFVEIDGIRYVPPAPAPEPVRRWEIELALGRREMLAAPDIVCVKSNSDPCPTCDPHCEMFARAKLGFDDTGRVWMADDHAKLLAANLRDIANFRHANNNNYLVQLRLAADRLAGPEPDAGGAK